MSKQLLKSITVGNLTEYFEYLDGLRESGITNMWGAAPYLQKSHRGMTKEEATTVLFAWMNTFDNALPAEDRVEKALNNV